MDSSRRVASRRRGEPDRDVDGSWLAISRPEVDLDHDSARCVGDTLTEMLGAVEQLVVGERRFVVTRAVASDVPALVELLADDELGRLREASDPACYRVAFAEIDEDPHQLLVAVRDEAGTVVGTMQLTLIPGLARAGAKRLQIEAVRLASGVRDGGLGSALFGWAHDYGREHGAVLAQLTSDKARTDAHRFYARLGYVASHEGFKLDL